MRDCHEKLDEKTTMKYTFFPSLVLAIIFVSITISAFGQNRFFKSSPAPEYRGIAADGKLEVTTIEFRNLKDSSRGDRNVPIKVHAPKEGGPFPVVIVSHGAGGHWDANYAQAKHLASHGFVALCLEHVGSNTAVLKKGFRIRKNLDSMLRDSNEVLGRPKDVIFAIEKAEEWNRSHDQLKGKLNLEKIGALGHSYGGYTTMAVCGMRPDLDDVTPPVDKKEAETLLDPRIDCGVALSPQGADSWAFNESSFGFLAVPLLGITGSKDRQKGGTAMDRRDGFKLWPKGQNHLVWIEGADHAAFSDSSGASGRRMLPSASRFDIQPVSRAATLLFLNAHLKGDKTALSKLNAKELSKYGRGASKNVQVFEK